MTHVLSYDELQTIFFEKYNLRTDHRISLEIFRDILLLEDIIPFELEQMKLRKISYKTMRSNISKEWNYIGRCIDKLDDMDQLPKSKGSLYKDDHFVRFFLVLQFQKLYDILSTNIRLSGRYLYDHYFLDLREDDDDDDDDNRSIRPSVISYNPILRNEDLKTPDYVCPYI